MSWFCLLMPWMLMVHNTVDFREAGARDAYINILNHVVTEYIEMLEENNNLKLVNKTGCMNEKIHKLRLHFENYDSHTVDSSRQMMLGLIYSFLDALNNGCHHRLRPFLSCPFTTCNIEIHVNYVDNSKFPYPAPGSVKYAVFADGTITYKAQDPRCLGRLEPMRNESLCFARQLAPPVQVESPYCVPSPPPLP